MTESMQNPVYYSDRSVRGKSSNNNTRKKSESKKEESRNYWKEEDQLKKIDSHKMSSETYSPISAKYESKKQNLIYDDMVDEK